MTTKYCHRLRHRPKIGISPYVCSRVGGKQPIYESRNQRPASSAMVSIALMPLVAHVVVRSVERVSHWMLRGVSSSASRLPLPAEAQASVCARLRVSPSLDLLAGDPLVARSPSHTCATSVIAARTSPSSRLANVCFARCVHVCVLQGGGLLAMYASQFMAAPSACRLVPHALVWVLAL